MSKRVALVGIGMGNVDLLTDEAKRTIESADAIIGASRMIKGFSEQGKICFEEYRAKEILSIIKAHSEFEKWVVVLSGDIGFYSGAKKLIELLKIEQLDVCCVSGIASVVYLASQLGVSWEDAALRSMHGRSQNIVYTIDHNEKTFILIDHKSGQDLCRVLKEYQFEDVLCYVGNRLSYPDQKITVKSGCELTPEDIGDLSTVFIVNPNPKKENCVHIRDDEFCRIVETKTVPMTKEEIRAVSIAKLGLEKNSILYDIGAGTGSISIEAALHGEEIRVYAVEKREDACSLIEKNKKKFRTDNVAVIQGNAPDAMGELEAPTHVFVGGSSGKLKAIIKQAKSKNPSVKIVINAISMETIGEVMTCIQEGILRNPEIIQMNVSKAKSIGEYHMMMGQNPIYIITEASKEE